MIEGFICTTENRSKERSYFRFLSRIALSYCDIDVTVIKKPMLERYYEAESLSTEELYIFSDDDVIPETQETLKSLLKILKDNPDYAIIGLSWKKNLKPDEIIGWVRSIKSEILIEVDHVGGIMAIRKGIIKNLGDKCDYKIGESDERIICRNIRKAGYKVGLYTGSHFHHLGAGHTSINWNSESGK